MSIDIRNIFEVTGAERKLDLKLDLSERDLSDYFSFTKPVRVTGSVANRAGIVTLNIQTDFTLRCVCGRCLDECDQDFSFTFRHGLVKEINAQNDDLIVLPDARLDLEEIVRTDILLEIPAKLLCKENCKGLCFQCGANLNYETCTCAEDMRE